MSNILTFSVRAGVSLVGILLVSCSSSGTPTPDLIDEANNENNLCLSVEVYDELEDACYLDCADLDDDQCDALELATYGALDEFVDENYQGSEPGAMSSDGSIAEFTVEADLTLTEVRNDQPANSERYREIWQSAIKILPPATIKEQVSQFHIDSDGTDGTLAYVVQDNNQIEKWLMAYDSADYTNGMDSEFIHTTIHEFGHLVFLRSGQIDLNNMGGCDSFSISEGCSAAASHLNRFYTQFWTDIIEEQKAAEASDDEAAKQAFYEKYEPRFVSPYAATNPVEDAAEVFTNFVLRERPSSSDSVVDRKIQLFYSIDELVQIRRVIRSKLSKSKIASKLEN